MNERIKELYTQVCMEQNLPFTLEHNSAYMLDAFTKKFAELIVRECMDQIQVLSRDAQGEWCGEWTESDVLKHFGVEE
jgi:hypothetical protein